MKIQCDVCSRDEATVFCCADEAALCDACDRKVHHANKLASMHRRFSFSSPQQSQPLCDICKERRGFVFCQEDRAILCWDCDERIHTCNQLTMKHNRFLLTGARLMELDQNSNGNKFNKNPGETNHNKVLAKKESLVISTPIAAPTQSKESGSNISDYLMKTLPGYRVEDLLIDDLDGLCKSDGMMPFLEPNLTAAEGFPLCVPHVPQIQSLNFLQTGVGQLVHSNYAFGFKNSNQNQQFHGVKGARDGCGDDSFMVPQNNTPVSSNNKRPRTTSSAWDF